jgi:hypothetical protein
MPGRSQWSLRAHAQNRVHMSYSACQIGPSGSCTRMCVIISSARPDHPSESLPRMLAELRVLISVYQKQPANAAAKTLRTTEEEVPHSDLVHAPTDRQVASAELRTSAPGSAPAWRSWQPCRAPSALPACSSRGRWCQPVLTSHPPCCRQACRHRTKKMALQRLGVPDASQGEMLKKMLYSQWGLRVRGQLRRTHYKCTH